MFFRQKQGLFAVARLDHLIAARPQQPRRHAAHHILVLDEQDAAGAGQIPRHRLGLGFLDHRRRRFKIARIDGQEDAESRAASWPGVDMDPAIGLLDDAIDGRQPQPRALADRLGGEEGFENLGEGLGGNARAIVGHFNQGAALRRRGGEAQLDRFGLGQTAGGDSHLALAPVKSAMTAKRVAGVDGQIHHRRLQLALVGADHGQVAAIIGDKADILAQEAAQQHLEFADQFSQIQLLALDGLLARKGQQFLDEVSRAHAGLADFRQALIAGIAHRMALQQLVQTQLNGEQQIVEVVGHAARQLADGLHLLALGQLHLHLFLAGDIHQIDGHATGAMAHQIEVGDGGRAGRIQRLQPNLDRSRRTGEKPLARLDQGSCFDQIAKSRAGAGAARRQPGQGGIDLDQGAFESVFALNQTCAKRRRLGEGVESAEGASARRLA